MLIVNAVNGPKEMASAMASNRLNSSMKNTFRIPVSPKEMLRIQFGAFILCFVCEKGRCVTKVFF